jgi:predicted metal-binding protein
MRVTSNVPEEVDTAAEGGAPMAASATIHICTTCRRPADLEDFPRPGAALARATAAAARGPHIIVRQVRCLANCKRGLSAAIRREGGWSYIFGDLDPESGAAALIQGAQLLAGSADGLMPWRGRPEPLKRGMIARLPPLLFEDAE